MSLSFLNNIEKSNATKQRMRVFLSLFEGKQPAECICIEGSYGESNLSWNTQLSGTFRIVESSVIVALAELDKLPCVVVKCVSFQDRRRCLGCVCGLNITEDALYISEELSKDRLSILFEFCTQYCIRTIHISYPLSRILGLSCPESLKTHQTSPQEQTLPPPLQRM